MNTFEDIMGMLTASSIPEHQGMERFGIRSSDTLGVKKPELHRMAKNMEENVPTAVRLRATGLREEGITETPIHPLDSMERDKVGGWLWRCEGLGVPRPVLYEPPPSPPTEELAAADDIRRSQVGREALREMLRDG